MISFSWLILLLVLLVMFIPFVVTVHSFVLLSVALESSRRSNAAHVSDFGPQSIFSRG